MLNDNFKRIPFTVPENYFETFKVNKSRVIDGVKQNPFAIPEDYFETFEVQKGFALTDEHKQIPFIAPVDYFEILQERIAARIIAPAARHMSIHWRPIRTQAVMAACLVVMVGAGISLFTFLRPTTITTPSVHKIIAEVEENGLYDVNEQAMLYHKVMNSSPAYNKEPYAGSSYEDDVVMHYLTNSEISLHDIASLY